jgi:protein arginine kinase activator
MLCDSCHQSEASIHVSQVIDGNSRELHLCEECAEESGLNVQNVMSIPEILFGLAGGDDASGFLNRRCPYCHLRGTDFKKTGRLGCERCYESFGEDLKPMLAAMHKGVTHKGKVPRTVRQVVEVKSRVVKLQGDLDDAIKCEDYERAAQVRDLIREAGHEAG